MKDFLDRLKEIFRGQKIYYLLVLLLFCMGVVIGVYTVKYMDERNKSDLISYFGNFTNSMGERNVDYWELFSITLKKNLFLIIPILILGFTFWGSFIILIIDLVKGFSLGYTFAFLISTFEGKGLVLALASIVPQNIVYIPCFIALSVIGIYFSANSFKERFSKKNALSRFELLKEFKNIVFVILVFFSFGLIIETYICPNLIKFVISNFYV